MTAKHRFDFCSVAFLTVLGALFVIVSVDVLRKEFPNADEIAHLPAGVSHWTLHNYDLYRVNPPLVRLIATIGQDDLAKNFDWRLTNARPEFCIGLNALKEQRLAYANLYFIPKCICLAFALLGLVAIYGLILQSLGRTSAMFAASLWCFCPNILAYGHSLCPDVGMVAFGVLTACACQRYYLSPSLSKAVLAGVVFGAALLTKMTWITGFAGFPLAVMLCRFVNRETAVSSRSWRLAIGDCIIFWMVASFVLNAGYQFEGSFQCLGEFQFKSRILGGDIDIGASETGNRFSGGILGYIPVPIPRNYLLGIDFLQYEVELKKWSFLRGEWKFGSWPHYYVMTTLFKTPESTLLLALTGLTLLIVGIKCKLVDNRTSSMFLLLGLPAGICFVSVSLQGGFNHHHRYVLMVYPFLFALGSYVLSPAGISLLRFKSYCCGRLQRSVAVPLALSLLLFGAWSSLRVHPYYTSYFNSVSGGPESGWHLLGLSNIDWGQDLLEIDKWLKAHPKRRPVVIELDYYKFNCDLFDLPNQHAPVLRKGASIDEIRETISETQWWIISVKKLYDFPNHDGLQYLQQLEPTEKIAFAYYVYRIDPIRPQNAP